MGRRSRSRFLKALAVTLPLGVTDPGAEIAREPIVLPASVLEDHRSIAAIGAILVERDGRRFACAALLVRGAAAASLPSTVGFRGLGPEAARGELTLATRDPSLAPFGYERRDGCVRVEAGLREARAFLDVGGPTAPERARYAWIEMLPGRWSWRPVRGPRLPSLEVAGAPGGRDAERTAEADDADSTAVSTAPRVAPGGP
ncbi:MAG TPA: hypothetical protein VLA66_12360 [Thermoanaerobaculia bacterium]|nr:hypothetical protein [Thermoanaerobaculia bacterium]